MSTYEVPSIQELGTVEDLTLNVYKSTGTGDIVYVNGQPIADTDKTYTSS